MAHLSFITTCNDERKYLLRGLVKNLQKHYSGIDYELIVSYQDDKDVFKRGQLINLGVKNCTGDIIVSVDNDIRFENGIDFIPLLTVHNGGFIYVDKTKQADENKAGILSNISGTQHRLKGYGMFCATKKRFMEVNGFSNLLSGWGAEDTLFYYRLGTETRLNNTVVHIRHGRDENYRNASIINKNTKLANSDAHRNSLEDGIRQTTAVTRHISAENNVKIYKFAKIGVSDGFRYRSLLNTAPPMPKPKPKHIPKPKIKSPPEAIDKDGLVLFYKRKYTESVQERKKLLQIITDFKMKNNL